MKYRPIYTITPRLLSEVEQVAALHERISAAAVQVAWIPALQKDTRVRNAHSSTAIEGNPLTMDQGTAGRYRTIPVRVGSNVAPPPEKVHGMMSALLDWWNIQATRISPILS